jgi:hypothetical protein
MPIANFNGISLRTEEIEALEPELTLNADYTYIEGVTPPPPNGIDAVHDRTKATLKSGNYYVLDLSVNVCRDIIHNAEQTPQIL